MTGVKVIAHRGASYEFPENTLAAFDEALGQGCDAIELDVQLSRDGIPVVYHDRTLARAGGGRRRVGRLDLEALRKLDAGAWLDRRFRGLHIPTLTEVLDLYGGRVELLIEMKNRAIPATKKSTEQLAHEVASMIEKRRLGGACTVLSFDPDALAACREAAPRIRCTLNVKPPRRMTSRILRQLPLLHAISADVRSLTPEFAAALHRRDVPLYVFTCNSPRRLARALRADPDGVMSDRPAWLREQLDEVGDRR